MNYKKINVKLCLIASVLLGIAYVLFFYFFPSASESLVYNNVDFSNLIFAFKNVYIGLFGLGISFYKFEFKSLRSKIAEMPAKLVKFLLAVFKIALYVLSFLLSDTYIHVFDPKPRFIFFVVHILYLIAGIILNVISETTFEFHSDNYKYPYLQLVLGKIVFILCALPLYVDFLGCVYLLLSLLLV